MAPSTCAAAAQAARVEELRGVCAKAFTHYENGHPRRGEKLLLKLLARHPRHPLLHYARVRLAHKPALELREPADAVEKFRECMELAYAAFTACRDSLLPHLLLAHVVHDDPTRGGVADDPIPLDALRNLAASAAARPLYAADLEYAKAITTFDEEVFALPLFPDVRGCADSAAYRSQALTNLVNTAPASFINLHREAEGQARRNRIPGQPMMGEPMLIHFMDLRDAERAAVAARRLQHVQARAREEEGDRALAAVLGVMAGEGTAHDLQEAAVGWREAADQGDASAQLLIGALYARGGGGVKKSLPLGKRYLELSAVAGSARAVALLKELRKCVNCGKLDVHHVICSQCRNARYCDKGCQVRHWEHPTDPHKLHCVRRRESAEAGGSSDRAQQPAHLDLLKDQSAAAAAARATGNDLFREQKYREVRPRIGRSTIYEDDCPTTVRTSNKRYRARRHYHSDVDDSGPYPKALEQYTQSITLNPNDAKVGHGEPGVYSLASVPLESHHIMKIFTLRIICTATMVWPCHAAYSNRAACHTELGAFAAAIEDAARCIALEPAWGKGYSRKGRVELLTAEYGMAGPVCSFDLVTNGVLRSHDCIECRRDAGALTILAWSG